MKRFLFAGAVALSLLVSHHSIAYAENDDIPMISHTETNRTSDTPCQVEAYFEMPPGFGHAAYVNVMDENGQVYNITCTEENGYIDYVYLGYGEYLIMNYGVVGDISYQYPLTVYPSESFSLDEDKNSHVIRFELDNYNEIAQAIKKAELPEEIVVAEPEPVETICDIEVFQTFFKDRKVDNNGNLYYEMFSETSKGQCWITGNSVADYNVVLTIIEPGIIGEAKFSISFDGGATVVGEDYVTEECKISGTGLKLLFLIPEDEIFETGETFSCMVAKTYLVQGNHTKSNIVCTSASRNTKTIHLNILKTGSWGTGKVTLYYDEKESDKTVITIPENGIYEGADFTLYFTNSDFKKGNYYDINIEPNIKKDNTNMLILIMVLPVGLCILAVISMNKKKKDNSSGYDFKYYR